MKNENLFINGAEYGPGKVFIIAELGTSHGADPVKAGELVDAAAEAGADCIKFQIVYANEILHPNTGEVLLPGGKIRLYDRFRELELDPAFFAEMKEKVEKKGLVFLCTPFGLKSARELKALEPKCIKIASPELNYSTLLKEIASYRLPTFLSTGVSKLADIEEALGVMGTGDWGLGTGGRTTQAHPLDQHAQPSDNNPTPYSLLPNSYSSLPSPQSPVPSPQVCLLHCVTAYPAPERDYNLRVLKSLGAVFGVTVGVSDHSLDPELVPVLGTAMGAAAIEKHFCLDRKDSGLDDPIALPPALFARMAASVRRAEKSGPEETLAALSRERGRDLVESILGDGVKRLAPSEKASYERTNRSVHALRDIQEGETIDQTMIAVLRTEKILRPGLPPSWEERIIGRRARKFIPSGEGIRFEDV